MANEQLRTTIQNYIKAFNSFDVDNLIAQFADDAVYEVVSNLTEPVRCEGKAQLKELATKTKTFFSARNQEISNWIISDNKAAVEFVYTATVAQDLPNGLKAGQSLRLRGISVYEFEGDKIKRLMDFG